MYLMLRKGDAYLPPLPMPLWMVRMHAFKTILLILYYLQDASFYFFLLCTAKYIYIFFHFLTKLEKKKNKDNKLDYVNIKNTPIMRKSPLSVFVSVLY